MTRTLERHFLPDHALGAIARCRPKYQPLLGPIQQGQSRPSRANNVHGALEERLEQGVFLQRRRQCQIRGQRLAGVDLAPRRSLFHRESKFIPPPTNCKTIQRPAGQIWAGAA